MVMMILVTVVMDQHNQKIIQMIQIPMMFLTVIQM